MGVPSEHSEHAPSLSSLDKILVIRISSSQDIPVPGPVVRIQAAVIRAPLALTLY